MKEKDFTLLTINKTQSVFRENGQGCDPEEYCEPDDNGPGHCSPDNNGWCDPDMPDPSNY